MIHILNAESLQYSSQARSVLSSLGHVIEADLDQAGLIIQIRNAHILIVRLRNFIGREVMDAAPNLKVIVSATTGLDHIDVACAAEKGISVLSLRGEVEFLNTIPATAEHTWALLLALSRKLPQAYQSVLQGEWDRDRFRGNDLAGRRLGIVGLGRIGKKVARYGMAFDMQVNAYDPYCKDWASGVERCETLESLCRMSDILSLHVPLNKETQNLITARELAWLPLGAIVLNTARGAVLDEEALLVALKNRKLSGAALDVISDETLLPRTQTSNLVRFAQKEANLLITPHIGGATIESMHMTELFMANKLANFLKSADRISLK
jgi:D-3-phosphoglycerate dehydrogenase